MNPVEFEASLNKGDYRSPVGQHLTALHRLMFLSGLRGDALAAGEHHLREMYVATAQYHRPYAELAPAALESDWMKRVGAAMVQASKNMQATVDRMRAKREAAQMTPEQRDAASKRKYDNQVGIEHRAGMAHVRREAARVRKEMGLS